MSDPSGRVEPGAALQSWSWWRAHVAGVLSDAGRPSHLADARWLTEFVSGHEGAEWQEVSAQAPTNRQRERLLNLAQRCADGEPLQYVIGEWSFRQFDVAVDPRVLIPRPETEWVVEIAIEAAAQSGLQRGRASIMANALASRGDAELHHVADLGTGSGVIAISLAAELPETQVWACDASHDALHVARANAIGNAAHRVRCAHGSWFDALPDELRGKLRLVVANPPYISEDEFVELDQVVRDHEPKMALVSGPTGSEAVEAILMSAPEWLAPGAPIVIELATVRAYASAEFAMNMGMFRDVRVRDDLTGRARALVMFRNDV